MALVCLSDFEKEAKKFTEKTAYDYYNSGAGDELSLKLNITAFKRLRIRPRCLRNVDNLDTRFKLFGETIKWPVGISPTAMQRMAHPDGEIANARAAGKMGSIFTLSTLSTTSIEDVAAASPDTCKWFQLYVYKDRALTENLVRRAENAGFKAIVLTIDAPIFGQRRNDARNKFSLPQHLTLANFEGVKATGVHSSSGRSGLEEYVEGQFDVTITWTDVQHLIKFTCLPVLVKGILTREDAILAREYGCAGIIVSNHGARQLDTVPAAIEALPEVVSAVGNDMVVILDCGVRDGGDVFKALALGAKMVFIGRPVLWGLACGGQSGVEQVLEILKKDFEITLALTGCRTLLDINREMVVHESYYAKI